MRWLLTVACAGEDVVLLNMDETSIQNEYATKKGHVIDMAPQERTAAACFFQRMDISSTRTHMTLAAVISADPSIQYCLPQVIIPNDSKITRAERAALLALPPPVHTMLGQHGWVNTQNMKTLLTLIRRCVHAVRPGCKIVFLMDSANQHISNEVLVHAARLQIVLILVPGKLTWLIQPLDVSVFRVFKDVLKTKLLAIRIASATGTITMIARLTVLSETIQEILVNKDWSQSFVKVGASADLTQLRNTIKTFIPDISLVGNSPLTNLELCDLVGRHRIDIDTRFFNAPWRLIEARLAIADAAAPHPEALMDGALDGPAAVPMLVDEESAAPSVPEPPVAHGIRTRRFRAAESMASSMGSLP